MIAIGTPRGPMEVTDPDAFFRDMAPDILAALIEYTELHAVLAAGIGGLLVPVDESAAASIKAGLEAGLTRLKTEQRNFLLAPLVLHDAAKAAPGEGGAE